MHVKVYLSKFWAQYICQYKGREHFLCIFGLLPGVLSFDKVIWLAHFYRYQYSGINLNFLWFFNLSGSFKWHYYWWKDTVILSSYSLILRSFAHMANVTIYYTWLKEPNCFSVRKKAIMEIIKWYFKFQQWCNRENNGLFCRNMSL